MKIEMNHTSIVVMLHCEQILNMVMHLKSNYSYPNTSIVLMNQKDEIGCRRRENQKLK